MGEQHHRSSFLTEWFPSVGDIDTARFPDPNEVVAYAAATFRHVELAQEVESKVLPAGRWRRAVEARFVSTLQLIPDHEFQDGLAAFDAAYPNPDQPVEYVLTFDRIRLVV